MWDDRRSAPWHCIAGMKEDCLIYPSGRGGIMSYGESSCLLAAHGPDAGLEERCLTFGSKELLPRGGLQVLSLCEKRLRRSCRNRRPPIVRANNRRGPGNSCCHSSLICSVLQENHNSTG